MGIIDVNAILKERIPLQCKTCKHRLSIYFFDGRKLLVPKHQCDRIYGYNETCEYWESREEILNKQQEAVKDILYEIRDKLTIIETMLIEENKNAPQRSAFKENFLVDKQIAHYTS